MIGTLLAAWPGILAGLFGLLAIAGSVFGVMKGKDAQLAKSRQETAEAKAKAAQDQTVSLAADNKAANEAFDAVQDAARSRAQTDAAVAALAPGEAEKEMRRDFQRD